MAGEVVVTVGKGPGQSPGSGGCKSFERDFDQKPVQECVPKNKGDPFPPAKEQQG